MIELKYLKFICEQLIDFVVILIGLLVFSFFQLIFLIAIYCKLGKK